MPTKFDTPNIWDVINKLHALAAVEGVTAAQRHAYQEWIEEHYITGESFEKSYSRFKRTNIAKSLGVR